MSPESASDAARIRDRLARSDWARVARDLDAAGYARLPGLLDAAQCDAARALYRDERRFRSFVDLGAKRFGDHGDYRYFASPLPALVGTLRSQLYARLAPIANRWCERLGDERRYPARLRPWLEACHAAGQTRPTPLVLRYEAGGYNCLHQDRYGALAFPLQVAVLLSRPGRDFEGGEFLLVEQRPRMQSRGAAIALERGEAIVFPNAERPADGARRTYRVAVRHGVSPLARGERYTLGLIFHDAR